MKYIKEIKQTNQKPKGKWTNYKNRIFANCKSYIQKYEDKEKRFTLPTKKYTKKLICKSVIGKEMIKKQIKFTITSSDNDWMSNKFWGKNK